MLKRKNNENFSGIEIKKSKKLWPPPSQFPSDVLKWMKKNVENPKTSFKLMQISKYFQQKEFPCFVVKILKGSVDRLECKTLNNEKLSALHLSKNLWITEKLQIHLYDNFITILLPKIAVCDISDLHLFYANLKFEHFKFLVNAGNVRTFDLHYSLIKDANDQMVPLENIFECLPLLVDLRIRGNINTFNSIQNATNMIPPNLSYVSLNYVCDTVTLEKWFEFIQCNQQINFSLTYNRVWPAEVIPKLQVLTDNLIQAWSPKNKPPSICFKNQTDKSKEELENLKKIFMEQ